MAQDLVRFIAELKALRPVKLADYRALLATDLPAVLALEDCPQNPRWHAEGNVFIHTQWVLDEVQPMLASLPYDEALALYLAALLHDIGKPLRTQLNREGQISASGHETAGIHLARSILYKFDLPYHLRREVLAQVARHYLPYTLVRRGAAAYQYIRLSHELNTRILYQLEVADFRGRLGEGVATRLQEIDEFRRQCEHYQCFGQAAPPLLEARDLAELGITDEREARRIQREILAQQMRGELESRAAAREFAEHARRPEQPWLYLPIGIPGAGKSTWVAAHLPGLKRISMDDKRAELLGDARDQSQNQRIFDLALRELGESLRAGQTVVFDATNRNQKGRQLPTAIARTYHAGITLIYFDLPLEVALERNQQRPRQVPTEVIEEHYQQLEEPEVYEGTEIVVVTTGK